MESNFFFKKVDEKIKEILKKFLEDIEKNDKNINKFLGDNQKRSFARDALSHSSLFPCEYCFAKGVSMKTISGIPSQAELKKQYEIEKKLIDEKLASILEDCDKIELINLRKTIDDKMKETEKKRNRSQITWPSSTANAELRTTAKVLDIVNNIANLTSDQKKGIRGRSLFLDRPSFCFVVDIPAEYLHSMCLGVVKKLVELTFSVGQIRTRITKRKLSSPALFNTLMAAIKTPREFPRRARDLDFSVMKGTEFRNLSLFYFPLIIECIEPEEGERKLWLFMAYMIRSCTLPCEEFEHVDNDDINDCCKKYYSEYERLMGAINCTYNTHVVLSHLLLIRGDQPLTAFSTFEFESFYGEMRHAFVPGTPSPLKQIMRKILLKRALARHSCESPIYYSNRKTSLQNNSYIYCWNDNDKTHDMFVITEIIDDDNFSCQKMTTFPHTFPEIPHLNWEKVGFFKKGEILADSTVVIKKENISGKVLHVLDYLITCPNNVLREK